MATTRGDGKRKITIRLDGEIVRKAKAVAAKRSISLNALLAGQIEILAEGGDTYERAKRKALALLRTGFDLSGEIRISRDELHKR